MSKWKSVPLSKIHFGGGALWSRTAADTSVTRQRTAPLHGTDLTFAQRVGVLKAMLDSTVSALHRDTSTAPVNMGERKRKYVGLRILEAFNSTTDRSPAAVKVLLTEVTRLRMTRFADQAHAVLKKRQAPMDAEAYGILLECYAANGLRGQMDAVVSGDMRQDGISHNSPQCLAAYVRCCAVLGDHREADRFMALLVKATARGGGGGCHPSIVYATLHLMRVAPSVARAVHLFESLPHEERSVKHRAALLKACSVHGDTATAERYWEARDATRPTTQLVCAMLRVRRTALDWAGAVGVVEAAGGWAALSPQAYAILLDHLAEETWAAASQEGRLRYAAVASAVWAGHAPKVSRGEYSAMMAVHAAARDAVGARSLLTGFHERLGQARRVRTDDVRLYRLYAQVLWRCGYRAEARQAATEYLTVPEA